MPDAENLIHRICDLMTGQVPTANTVTFEGYVHCAAIMINGLIEEKAGQVLYLAKGGLKGGASQEDCWQVPRKGCRKIL